jgi:hypothetical protein
MNRALLILFACLAHAVAAEPPQAPLFGDGTYVGMEPMHNISPDEPKARWFHENTLKISGDAVILNKSPVWFKNAKKFYSASDGGFYGYRGSVSFADGHWHMDLLLTESDYVAVRIDKDRKPIPPKPQQFTITRMDDRSFVVDKVTYRRSKPE